MLRTVQSLPLTGLPTLGPGAGRFPPTPPACYRASWQLPGPDSHRQATTSLRTRRTPRHYVTVLPPALLGARKIEDSDKKSSAGKSPHDHEGAGEVIRVSNTEISRIAYPYALGRDRAQSMQKPGSSRSVSASPTGAETKMLASGLTNASDAPLNIYCQFPTSLSAIATGAT